MMRHMSQPFACIYQRLLFCRVGHRGGAICKCLIGLFYILCDFCSVCDYTVAAMEFGRVIGNLPFFLALVARMKG